MGVKDYTGTLPAVRQCEMKKCDPCLTKKNAIPKKVPYQKVPYQKKYHTKESAIPKGFIGVLRESTHSEVVPKSDTV